MLYTTFERLHKAGACHARYRFRAKALGGIAKYGRKTPISILQILDANGPGDALWALETVPGAEAFDRLLACDYAEHVLLIWEKIGPNDNRPRQALEVARRSATAWAATARAAEERRWQEAHLREKLCGTTG